MIQKTVSIFIYFIFTISCSNNNCFDVEKQNEDIDKKRKEHEEKINKLDEEKQKAFEDCESKNGIIVMTFGVRAVCINKSAVIFEREIY